MFTSVFTNRPAYDSQFLPNNYNLNVLRKSGWYAPTGTILNGPDNFYLYNIFVVAPRPDEYAYQMAFGVAYRVSEPSTTHGDEVIIDGEVIKDRYGNLVFTQRRLAADVDSDGTIDTDNVIIDTNDEQFNVLRVVTNQAYNDDIHISSADDSAQDDIHVNNIDEEEVKQQLIKEHEQKQNGENTPSSDTTIDNNIKQLTGTININDQMIQKNDNNVTPLGDIIIDSLPEEEKEEIIATREIIDDSPEIIITNRSAIYVRAYINSSWTPWTTFGGSTSTTGESSSTGSVTLTEPVNFEKIYSYIDGRLSFTSARPEIGPYGLQVEITGTYNEAPYDPSYNVYGVAASGIEYSTVGDFPEIGDPQKLYIVTSENRLYRWSDVDGRYWCIGTNYNEITHIISDLSAYDEEDENNNENSENGNDSGSENNNTDTNEEIETNP